MAVTGKKKVVKRLTLYNLAEVGKMLGASRMTLLIYRRKGILPPRFGNGAKFTAHELSLVPNLIEAKRKKAMY